jgi:glycine betaine/choline ABC-type transport system substrate-binding protein
MENGDQMSRSLRAILAVLAVLALGVVVAACGGDDSGSSSSTSTSTGGQAADTGGGAKPGQLIEADPANKGKKIAIGSKNFPEQFILGEIYSQALTAAGFDVKKSLDLGAEQIAFKALKGGQVDAYPEYTGTALTSFYKVKVDDVPRDPQQAFDQLKGEAAKDNITTLPQTPFQNTYKVTSTKETAAALGNPKTLSELAPKAQDKRLSGFPECRQRTDCLLGLNKSYDWNPKFVSSTGQYADLDAGEADFTMGFSTDGPLSLDKYSTYEDDKQLFPPYYVTLLTRNDALERLGQGGQDVIQAVQKPLTEKVMQELNARVSVDKQKPEQVAQDYLRESGFIK